MTVGATPDPTATTSSRWAQPLTTPMGVATRDVASVESVPGEPRDHRTSVRPASGWPWLSELRGLVTRHRLAADCLMAAALLMLVGARGGLLTHVETSRIFAVLLVAPLVLRRRYPRAVFASQCLVALAQWMLGSVMIADAAL
ncbi:MAG TPA: hypothetical protein VGD84_02020, partial [Pseudonocardiaceae bacterium]